ncbi:cytochrome P450 [Streptomyces sp. NPDC006285]|uniref:cytochrome P450 family protein n=1 Tax=Streptomyces sp. NPDC006285 TaxID=3364742 RepID=UPI00367383A2
MARDDQILALDPSGFGHHGENHELLARGPVTQVDLLGVKAWAVSDPHLLKKLLTNPDVSKDGKRHWPAYADSVEAWPLKLWTAVNNMFTAYGGDHSRLRRMISPAFSARRIAALQPVIDDLVSDLLDGLDDAPDGEVVDLRARLAYPLPIGVIGQLLGIPEDQRPVFRVVVDGVFSTGLTKEQAEVNTVALYQLLDKLITTKRGDESADDLTSYLIARHDESEQNSGDRRGLSDEELRDTLLLMISAGYETTVNVIDYALTLLLSDPGQLAHVREGHCNWNDVVEETLRCEPAVRHLPLRYAVTDIPLPGGQTITAGEPILASYAAANRNPNWHDHADEFDVMRVTKDHLAFGYGVHFCLGAPLARREVATVLSMFFARFPDAQFAVPVDELKPLPSFISNGHTALPVRLHPSTG